MINHFAQNTQGRDLIIGDIHGHFEKAMAALLSVGFDPSIDRVFSVGDLVDRGPESVIALDWLEKPWFHAVRGNHEQMCIDRVDGYMHMVNGGGWFLGLTYQEQQPYVDAFADLPIAMSIETAEGLVVVVHGDLSSDSWINFQQRLCSDGMERDHFVQSVIWSRERIGALDDSQVEGLRAVVVGHTPVGRMTSLGNVIYIDTGGWLPEARFPGRQFTVLDAATLAPAYAPVMEFGA